MDSLYSLTNKVNTLVEEFLEEKNAFNVKAKQLNWDDRSGGQFYVSIGDYEGDGFIACNKNTARTANYYSGLEYVDTEYVTTVGDMVFYSAEASRIKEAIDFLKENITEDEDVDTTVNVCYY